MMLFHPSICVFRLMHYHLLLQRYLFSPCTSQNARTHIEHAHMVISLKNHCTFFFPYSLINIFEGKKLLIHVQSFSIKLSSVIYYIMASATSKKSLVVTPHHWSLAASFLKRVSVIPYIAGKSKDELT